MCAFHCDFCKVVVHHFSFFRSCHPLSHDVIRMPTADPLLGFAQAPCPAASQTNVLTCRLLAKCSVGTAKV